MLKYNRACFFVDEIWKNINSYKYIREQYIKRVELTVFDDGVVVVVENKIKSKQKKEQQKLDDKLSSLNKLRLLEDVRKYMIANLIEQITLFHILLSKNYKETFHILKFQFMGQNDSKQIQQTVALLELQNAIQHIQAQKFLHDYHTNDPIVQDVKNFDQNKLKMFLKYFILEKYTGRALDKQNSKRVKTNQSVIHNEDSTYHNLTSLLCFEIYRIDENLNKVYQLISTFLLNPSTLSFNEACKEIIKILGVKQCSVLVLNKSNIQQMKISFSKQKNYLKIKQKGLQQSPYPRSQKYRFRKLKKSQLIKQKIIIDESQLCSDVFYVEEIPTKDRSSVLVMSFEDQKTIQTFGEKADSKNIVEKYVSTIGQFLMKMASLSHFSSNNQNPFKQMSTKSNSMENSSGQYQIAQICWNLLKVYKTSFDFEHSLLVEKIKKQHRSLVKPNAADVSYRQLKIQLIEKIKSQATSQCESNDEIIDFLNQYEKKHLVTRNQISEYLQKYFQAISQDMLEFQFDSNTELKVFVCSRQTKQNQSIYNIIRESLQKGNTPTLLDIFKDLKAFREFYKKSYQQALKEQDEEMTFEHEGVILQFKFFQQAIQNIKISVSVESLAEKYRRSVVTSPRHSVKVSQKKKFSQFHNEGIIEQANKENVEPIKKHDKEAEMIRISIRTSSNKNLNTLDLTAQVDSSSRDFDIYDPSLDILKIKKPLQFKLAYEIINHSQFYKVRHPQFSQKLINFLQQLKEGYQENNNPFHNFTHGVNVMHTAFLLTNIPNLGHFMTDFTKFTLIISALCHDVGHTGFNNAFEIAKGSYIAQLFNDVSPLQNYHISRSLAILKSQECDFMDFLSKDQKVKFRKLFISNILNTDMKEHFNVLKKYQQKKNTFKKDDLEDEKVLCGMLIHSSDFGASTKDFQVCKEWSRLVNEQFMKQSKKEGQLGIPLSPFMLNLDNELVMAKNELGFLKFMVQPLFKSISQSFGGERISEEMIRNVNKNIESWDGIIKGLSK